MKISVSVDRIVGLAGNAIAAAAIFLVLGKDALAAVAVAPEVPSEWLPYVPALAIGAGLIIRRLIKK